MNRKHLENEKRKICYSKKNWENLPERPKNYWPRLHFENIRWWNSMDLKYKCTDDTIFLQFSTAFSMLLQLCGGIKLDLSASLMAWVEVGWSLHKHRNLLLCISSPLHLNPVGGNCSLSSTLLWVPQKSLNAHRLLE